MTAKAAASPWFKKDRATEREEKREAVLHAAAQAFSDKGFYRTSLDEIAERLGITKPTLYYYARNKEDLVVAVGARALQQIIAAFYGDSHAPALDQLKHLLRAYARVTTTDFGRCLVDLSDSDLGAEAGARIRADKKKIDDRLRELLAAGMRDGSIGACDIRLTSFMLAGAINGIAGWYSPDGAISADALADAYVNQLVNGLMPRS